MNTGSTSADSDYYSAYTKGELPPSAGWVSRLPGISPTAGCGCNPPPSHVGIPIERDAESVSSMSENGQTIVKSRIGCSPVMTRKIVVRGAGSASANGVYIFSGELRSHPYYRKHSGTFNNDRYIWHFTDCPLEGPTGARVSFNGWYISKDLDSSSYSASKDMYSCYTKSPGVPGCYAEDEGAMSAESSLTVGREGVWVVRAKGLGPAAGCGKVPAPSVSPFYSISSDDGDSDVDDDRDAKYVMLVRVSCPNGEVFSFPASERDTVLDVQLKLDHFLKTSYHRILIYNRGDLISDKTRCHKFIFECGIRAADLLSVEVAPDELSRAIQWEQRIDSAQINALYNSYVSEKLRNVVVVGAGPVGKW